MNAKLYIGTSLWKQWNSLKDNQQENDVVRNVLDRGEIFVWKRGLA